MRQEKSLMENFIFGAVGVQSFGLFTSAVTRETVYNPDEV